MTEHQPQKQQLPHEDVEKKHGGAEEEGEQKITPWEVHAEKGKGVDYLKLVNQFGSELIDDKLLARFEKLTGRKPHRWLRRGYFFSHR